MGRRKGVPEFDESPPDDFDPANPYKDPVAFLEMREHLVREKWIDIETAKIIRERVKWCYRVEGINHLQKCRHLVQQYLDSTRGIGWGKDARHPSLHEFQFVAEKIGRDFNDLEGYYSQCCEKPHFSQPKCNGSNPPRQANFQSHARGLGVATPESSTPSLA